MAWGRKLPGFGRHNGHGNTAVIHKAVGNRKGRRVIATSFSIFDFPEVFPFAGASAPARNFEAVSDHDLLVY